MKRLTKVITGNRINFGDVMPNPDMMIGANGVRMSVFDEMIQDAHIYAKLEQLKDAVLSMKWDVRLKKQAEDGQDRETFVKECLSGLGVASLLSDMITAVEYGFSVTEIVWELKEGRWIPVRALGRRAGRFFFDNDGRLTLNDSGRETLDEKYKLIVHRNSPKNENPYGTSVLTKCYWPWMFKKAGFRYWLTVAEKYGVPTVLALFDSNDETQSRERAKELAQNLFDIQNDAAVALANVDSVQVLEARGSSSDFSELVSVCNQEISKAITGEILTSDATSTGSYALSVQHMETLNRKSRKIAGALAATITDTLVRWIEELNFGGESCLSFVLDEEAEASWDIIKDACGLDMKVDMEEVARRFGIPLK